MMFIKKWFEWGDLVMVVALLAALFIDIDTVFRWIVLIAQSIYWLSRIALTIGKIKG